jgi:hypothetical protein
MLEVDKETAIESLKTALRNYQTDWVDPNTLAIISRKALRLLEHDRDHCWDALLKIGKFAKDQLDDMNVRDVPDNAPERIVALWYYTEAITALLNS